jgi:hypothetical protein
MELSNFSPNQSFSPIPNKSTSHGQNEGEIVKFAQIEFILKQIADSSESRPLKER